jgi:glycosyltransferase involved in cell wall biosynthesis
MLEAMAYGAVPIQTCTACADEWIVDGVSGFISDPEDISGTADSIVKAMTDDLFAEQSFRKNWDVLCSRASDEHVRKVANSFYDIAYEKSRINKNSLR